MTALPPYLEKRKEFFFEYLKNFFDLSGLDEEVKFNQDWSKKYSKWGLLIMGAWKAAKICNFLTFLQVKAILWLDFTTVLKKNCRILLGREISDYCA